MRKPGHTRRPRSICIFTLWAAFGICGWATADDSHKGHGGNSHAIGVAGDPAKVTRTIDIGMSDAMRFTPAYVQAKQGETIRFVVRNSGQLKHEFVLGTKKELKEHYEQMKKFPNMVHFDPNMVTVAPGQTGEVVWRFTSTGPVDFACLQPGHYDGGMKGVVMVRGKKAGDLAPSKADSHTDHQH